MVMMTVEITVMNKDAVSECVFTCKCIIIIIIIMLCGEYLDLICGNIKC